MLPCYREPYWLKKEKNIVHGGIPLLFQQTLLPLPGTEVLWTPLILLLIIQITFICLFIIHSFVYLLFSPVVNEEEFLAIMTGDTWRNVY